MQTSNTTGEALIFIREAPPLALEYEVKVAPDEFDREAFARGVATAAGVSPEQVRVFVVGSIAIDRRRRLAEGLAVRAEITQGSANPDIDLANPVDFDATTLAAEMAASDKIEDVALAATVEIKAPPAATVSRSATELQILLVDPASTDELELIAKLPALVTTVALLPPPPSPPPPSPPPPSPGPPPSPAPSPPPSAPPPPGFPTGDTALVGAGVILGVEALAGIIVAAVVVCLCIAGIAGCMGFKTAKRARLEVFRPGGERAEARRHMTHLKVEEAQRRGTAVCYSSTGPAPYQVGLVLPGGIEAAKPAPPPLFVISESVETPRLRV